MYVDVTDGKRCLVACLKQLVGIVGSSQTFGILGAHAVRRVAVDMERARNAEIRFCHEIANLVLTLHYQPHGHRLHTSGRECRLDTLPKHGRELEAHYAVEHTACLLGVDPREVNLAGIGYGIEYGLLGDFVKNYSPGFLGREIQDLI